ncbi:MAG TPA: ribosome silencing factor [Steroidobacteraceae bacterium]|nr:ribosome silencing factor [Steroidobacteraceae bacterium]
MPQRSADKRKSKTTARKTPAKAKTAAKAKAPRKSASGTRTTRLKASQPAASSRVLDAVQRALDDLKAVNVTVLDVRELTDITDTMVVASGTSDRHVRSLADRIVEYAKKAGFRPAGVEGERDGEWVLVDLQDVIVHVMLPRVREFYRLENLWDVSAARRAAANDSADRNSAD